MFLCFCNFTIYKVSQLMYYRSIGHMTSPDTARVYEVFLWSFKMIHLVKLNFWFSRTNHIFSLGFYLIKFATDITAQTVDTILYFKIKRWAMSMCVSNDTVTLYFSLYVFADDCKVNFSFKYGIQSRSKFMRGFWNHSCNLAKWVLTFSVQANEMPTQTRNLKAFERNLVWLNWN